MAFAGLLCLEQTRVLDGDYGLISKGLDEGDLGWVNGATTVRASVIPPIVSAAQQGHGKDCADVSGPTECDIPRAEPRLAQSSEDLDRTTRLRSAPESRA